jgi:glycosyltransferase involved in cell wall biosynthesis
MNISILILTLNEEINLTDCLASVAWSDDVVVVDSHSSDRTVEIAQAAGARVVQRRFDNWAAHQNYALEHIPFKYSWVFYLDADERMTPDLKAEILAIAADRSPAKVAYYCGRKNFFMGRWIRHAMPPGLIMRFFQPPHIRFERLVNPTPAIDGEHGYLRNYFEHYNFSKGIGEWINKHNNYSQMEAIEGIKLLKGESGAQPSLLSRDYALRRKALKNLSFRLPLRPLFKFAYLYLFKRGFLDGQAGLTYCILQSIYEYLIVLKMREIQRRERGLPV